MIGGHGMTDGLSAKGRGARCGDGPWESGLSGGGRSGFEEGAVEGAGSVPEADLASEIGFELGVGSIPKPAFAPESGAAPEAAATPEAAAAPGAAAPALAIRNLSFSYPQAAEAVLREVSLELPQRAFALVVGATGSGKSTLLSLIKPEIAPAGERAGAIEVFGRAPESFDARESARTVGFVFQSPENQIVCESVWHEMAFGLENLGTPQDEMRRLVAETSYFFGMEEWIRHDTATLSGGRKQLLALASTLVMQPRLLLLDEPTAQLDPIAEKSFLHALFRVNRELGCTVVVATHSPRAMVDYATCAFELADGALEPVESLDGLRVRPRLLSAEGSAAPAAARPAGAVALERVWFRYGREERWVLRNLDLRVEGRCIHALVGGNGCGKSTLLALVAGMQKPARGRVRAAAGAKVLLPQDPKALFAMETVEDELMEWSRVGSYGCVEVRAMLERMGLSGCAGRHPYDLSGGQQQLLALGKALLMRPALLLLDEPTKGLDADARRLVAATLRTVRDAGATVLVATHDLDFVEQVADTVSMMFDGEIACTQQTGEFFEGNVYYRP